MADAALIGQEAAARAIADALRLWVGAGRRYSLAAVAAAGGIPERTVKSYRAGETTPSFANFLTLAGVLGPQFFNACLRGLPFEVRATDPDDTTPQELLADVCGFSAGLAQALADGRIDHRERPEILAGVRDLQCRLSALAKRLEVE